MPEPPLQLPEDGPTRLVEGNDGELVERLSGGTATLLLVWLLGIGAGSALLGAWLLAAVILRIRLGGSELLGAPGLYLGLLGASGPTVLWLTGRAQGRSLRWFMLTAAKIGLVMDAILIGGTLLVSFVMGVSFAGGALIVAGALVVTTMAASVLWALATWSADRYIAGARVASEDQTS
ncbi:MAG: hypothetical protein ABI578_08350 [Chloroflexota bacterium]